MRHKNMIDYRLDHGSQIMDYRSFNNGSWIIDHSIMDHGLWIIQLWIMDYRSFNHGSWIIDHGLWITDYGSFNHGSWIIDYRSLIIFKKFQFLWISGYNQYLKAEFFDNHTVQFLNGYSLNQTPHINFVDGIVLYVGNEVIIHHHHKGHHYHHHHYHHSSTNHSIIG